MWSAPTTEAKINPQYYNILRFNELTQTKPVFVDG